MSSKMMMVCRLRSMNHHFRLTQLKKFLPVSPATEKTDHDLCSVTLPFVWIDHLEMERVRPRHVRRHLLDFVSCHGLFRL